jgi:hypothetical protein
MSQGAAAELIGCHAKHLQRVEAGQVNLKLLTLVAAAMIYGVKLDALFKRSKTRSARSPKAPRPSRPAPPR